MPIYQGYGPFPITVSDRSFSYSFTETGPSFSDFDIESEDGGLMIEARGDSLAIWGKDFPSTSQRRPLRVVYTFEGAIRSPEGAVRKVIDFCNARTT